MGHPYSKRFPKDYLGIDDRIINRQTGALNRSIRRRVETRGKKKVKVVIWAAHPAAGKLVRGTRLARERNFLQLAYERVKGKVSGEEKRFLKEVEKDG